MRKRHQEGGLKRVSGSWVGQWWEDGHRRNRVLGRVSEMTKSDARNVLEDILAPSNKRLAALSEITFEDFVEHTFFPWFRHRWKPSTSLTSEGRIKCYLLREFAGKPLSSFTRKGFQDFLDRKAAAGLSFSTVDHLRWDLKQIFRAAVAEGCLARNPAEELFTPREARRALSRVMTMQDVRLLFSVLGLRERVVSMLATLCGMRPGEILALQWRHIREGSIEIQHRLYKGKIDSPKSGHSVRVVAVPEGVRSVLWKWRTISPDSGPNAWIFPSERLQTPIAKDNLWRRHFAPALKAVGLGWVNFQVMRRTHASLMRQLNVDPKLVADQLGHTLDVNLNVYTSTPLEARREAVNTLEQMLCVM